MSYCEVENIEAQTGFIYTATSKPTRDEVTTIVEVIAAEIDGVLQAAGYTVPVSASTALGMLRYYNILGASYRSWHAGVSGTDRFPKVESWETDYRAFLARIRKGEQQLPGVAPLSDLDGAFQIVPTTRRDHYWSTGQKLS